MEQILERELNTYEKQREQLLANHEGMFVLIHADEAVGVFESQADAIAQGYERFGNVPFLVRQIVRVETPVHLPSHLLAV